MFQRERTGLTRIAQAEGNHAAGGHDAGADGEQALADTPDGRGVLRVQIHGKTCDHGANHEGDNAGGLGLLMTSHICPFMLNTRHSSLSLSKHTLQWFLVLIR